MNYIEEVRKFHELFEHPINSIGEEHLSVRQLRIKLLFEELKELAEASDCLGTFHQLCWGTSKDTIVEDPKGWYKVLKPEDGNNVNHKEELDALCDLQYVLSGKVLTGGYHNVFDAAFQEVQDSNMSKACEGEISAKATIDKYKKEGINCDIVERQGRYIIKRDDGKVLKNIKYKPADLDRFVNGY